MPKREKSPHTLDLRHRLGDSGPSALPLGVPAGVAIIVAAILLVYFSSINGGFVLDDDLLVTENKIIKASDGLYRFWCTTDAQDYWPVTNTSFWIEWRLWGMNPTGYHVTNLILHIIETLLIWCILRKLSIPGAFWAALIFALHPVNVESVSWIASRKNLMSMLFFLLSILGFLKSEAKTPGTSAGAKRGNTTQQSINIWYCLSLLTFLLAMLSKGSAVVLPVLLLGIVWWLRPLTRWDLLRTGPFFAVAAVMGGVNVWFQTHGSGVTVRMASFTERLLGAGAVVWFYLYKALVPFDLSFIYPQWHIKTGNPLWWMPLAAALAVTAVLWRFRENWSRAILFAWGLFCTALLPVMGFTDVGFMQASLVADHYQHIALIGVVALAGAGWGLWHRRAHASGHWAAIAVAVAAAAVLMSLTSKQSAVYRDAATLYQDTLDKNPDCYMAHYNLGNALNAADQIQRAIEHYQQALTLKPDYVEAHNNLGIALAKADRLPEAIEHCAQAIRLKPNFPEAYNNMGLILAKAGRLGEAIEHFQRALRLKTGFLEAHYNLGNALVEAGRQQEAIEQFEQVLRLKPDLVKVYGSLTAAYAQTNQPSKAVATARKALELARSQGQTALAKEIEDWLNSYRAEIGD